MSDPSITFYLPTLADPTAYDGIDPDVDWTPFKNARAQWIPQTYVRLRQAGHAVRVTNEPPARGLVVVFAGDMRQFLSACRNRDDIVIVCAQADRRVADSLLADVIVRHNGFKADGRRCFFIPNWPQAGLVERNGVRGSAVRTVCFKGNLENLERSFLSREWSDFLQRCDLDFVVDADLTDADVDLSGSRFPRIIVGSKTNWNDYSDVDVVLAVRPHRRDMYPHKPAVKLVNAWRAGVPPVLGPEHAYRELRRSKLDYFEVTHLTEAMDVLDRLRKDPRLYQGMIENGRARAVDFSVASITREWEKLLLSTLHGWRPRKFVRMTNSISVPIRRAVGGVARRAAFSRP